MSKKRKNKRTTRTKNPLNFEALEPRQLLAADVAIEWIPLETQPLVGETVDVSLQFSNSGDSEGFGPYVNIVVPGGGTANEGLQYITSSGSMLDSSLSETVIEFDANGVATHPFANDSDGNPMLINGTFGDQLVVFELPFGSFTHDQPAMQIDLQLKVNSTTEDGSPLQLEAIGGLQYGNDALDNPETDPVIESVAAALEIVPDFVRTEIEYLGPGNETATGENFIQSYEVTFNVVEGIELSNLDIIAQIDSNAVFMGVRNESFGDQTMTITQQPTIGEAANGSQIAFTADSWTGIEGTDGSFIFDIYVPEFDANGEAVIDADTAVDSGSVFQSLGTGNWIKTPATEDTAAEIISFASVPATHELQGEFIALQQTVRINNDVNASSYSPGDELAYALDFQISDYAELDDLKIEFTVPNGQQLENDRPQTFRLRGVSQVNGTEQTFDIDIQQGASWTLSNQVYEVDVAAILESQGLSSLLSGAETDQGLGAVKGTINYFATILDEFQAPIASGDQSVDEGDYFRSTASATATNVGPNSLGFITADDSGTTIILAVSEIETSVHAINGVQGAPLNVSAGDLVTYKITREVRNSDVEDLVITDYLPLPVFSVDQLQWVGSSGNLSQNTIEIGSGDTFHSALGATPTLSLDPSNNSFSLDYGDVDSSNNETTTIEILVTVGIKDQPFADGLSLSSLANSSQGTSNHVTHSSNDITRITYTRPVLVVQKSAIGSNNADAAVVDGADLGTDIENVDAQDIVQFEVRIENTGLSEGGAHNVHLLDEIPAGFLVPSTGLNLTVVDGNGNSLDYTNSNGGDGLFDEGISLTDPIAWSGDQANSNVAIVTYELITSALVEADSSTTSAARAVNYSAFDNGENYSTISEEDNAITSFAKANIEHVVTATNLDHTQSNNVVIGETVTYKATVFVPEGTMSNAALKIQTPRGAAINELIGVSFSDAISVTGQTPQSIVENAVISDEGNDIRNGGRILSLDIGDIINTDSNNLTGEFVEVIYTATITNDAGNDFGDNRRNSATWTHDSGVSQANSNDVKIVEPRLELIRTLNDLTVDANDEVTVSLSVVPTQTLGATAFDIAFAETIPDGLTYVPGSFQWISGVLPTTSADTNGELTAQWNSIALNESSQFQYRAIVDADVHAGDTLSYDGNLSWSSLQGEPNQISPHNELTVERTGDSSDPGEETNDYITSFASTLTIPAVDISMQLVGTSELGTSGNDVTIGESSEYEIKLTIPEGEHAISLSGLDESIGSNVQLDSFEIAQIGQNLTVANGTVGTVVTVDENGELVLDLGNVINTADNLTNEADEIVLRLLTSIPDIANNADGDTSTVSTSVNYSFGTNTESQTQNIVEPKLVISQTVSGQAVDANDNVDVTISVQHLNTTGADAVSFNLAESLANSGLTIEPDSVTVNGAQIEQNSDGNIVIGKDLFGQSDIVTITYDATVNEGSTPGSNISLTPQITYKSADNESGRTYTGSDSDFVSVYSGQIAGSVLIDVNQDGLEQVGDTGINGATVTLVGIDHLDQPVSIQTQTNSSGQFSFIGVRPGTYSLVQSQPAGITDGIEFAGSAGGIVGQDRIDSIVVPLGQSSVATNYVFTETPRTWISGNVYFDVNENSQFGQDEPGLEGVEITLSGTTDEGESVSRTTFTDSNGYYLFGQLEKGTYSVAEGATDGYFDASEQLGSAGGQIENDLFTDISVAPLSAGTGYNFGEFYRTGSISGKVYIDLDRNDVQDDFDALIAAVTVSINGTNDLGETITASMVTDVDGRYHFEDLRPGTYQILTDTLADLDSSISNIGNFVSGSESVAGNGLSTRIGFDSIVLPAGFEAQEYNIGHVDPLFTSTNLETTFEVKTAFAGTNGDDEFIVSVSGDNATVMFDGNEYQLDNASSRSLRMLGNMGNDQLLFTGSENKESSRLRKHSGRISGTWFETFIHGMETMTIMGGGGSNEDVAIFNDTSGDDVFTAEPSAATMIGEGYSNNVHDVRRIYGYLSEGFDTASFIGEVGTQDTYRSTPSWAQMYNDNFFAFAGNADTTLAISTDDSDRAVLHDSTNDDTLYANEDITTFRGDGFDMTTSLYKDVYIRAGTGGSDSATFAGNDGNDNFVSRPTIATLNTGSTTIVGRAFDVVKTIANDGEDTARVHDSLLDDSFVADARTAVIQNDANQTSINGFDRVYAYMHAGGEDTATLNGSGAQDVFNANSEVFNITGGGSYVYGVGFASVVANGANSDRAVLHDSASNDTLNLRGNVAVMSGDQYSTTVAGYSNVTSHASDGNDRVVFRDSETESMVRVRESFSTIYGSGFKFDANAFDSIDAYYTDLAEGDNVDLNANLRFDLAEVDTEFANFKLSLIQDATAPRKVFNDRLNLLNS